MDGKKNECRSILKTRPFCCFGALFLSISFAAAFFTGDFKWIAALILGILLILSLILLLILKIRRPIGVLLILSACVPALLLSYFAADRGTIAVADQYAGKSVVCEMVVTDTLVRSAGFCSHEVMITRAKSGEDVRIRALLITPYDSYLDIGDRIRLPVTVSSAKDSTLGGSYYYSSGFRLLLNADADSTPDILAVGESVFPYTQTARLSHKIGLRIRSSVDADSAALINALICGDKSGLSEALREQISALGITHLFAVSGMHIGILIALFGSLLQKLRLSRRMRAVGNLAVAALYMAVCSFAPSVCRAFGMFLILSVGTLIGRRRDLLTALFVAGTAMVMLFPYLIWNIGFLLSFLSTLGILWLGLPVCKKLSRRFHGILLWLLSALAMTFSAKLFTLPITALCFGCDSLISPISSLVFTGLISLILSLSPILLLFSYFQPLGIQFGKIITLPCKAVYLLTDLVNGKIFVIRFRFPILAWASIAVFAAVLAILLFAKRKFLPCLLLYLAYIGSATLLSILLPITAPRMIEKNSGSNDALILTSGGHAILLDNSNGGYGFWSDCLDSADGYELTVDTLLLTHYHNYQISGLYRLFELGQIETLLLPAEDERTDGMRRLTDLASAYGVQVILYSGDRIRYRDLEIAVFRETLDRSTHNCTAFYVSDGESGTLYLSASVTECGGFADFLAGLPVPDRIWPGSHGPKAKSALILPDSCKNAEILSPDAEIDYVSPPS